VERRLKGDLQRLVEQQSRTDGGLGDPEEDRLRDALREI
jgi:hypothetical protein